MFAADRCDLAGWEAYVVAVATPIDGDRRPDLGPLLSAADLIGPGLRPGAPVVVESTVHPGATEEVVGPRLEAAPGLVRGRHFTLGYTPERIHPGTSLHRLPDDHHVVSGAAAAPLGRVAA